MPATVTVPGLAAVHDPDSPRRVASRFDAIELFLLVSSGKTRREWETSLWMSRGFGDAGDEVHSLVGLAAWHARAGHWGESVELAREAASLAADRGRDGEWGAALLLLGSIQYRRGRWPEGVAAWQQVVTAEDQGREERVCSLLGLARIAIRRGERCRAEETIRRAVLLARPAGETRLLALAHMLEGELAGALGERAVATRAFARAEDLVARISGVPELGAELWSSRALEALGRGDLDGAADWAARAGDLAGATADRYRRARAKLIEAAALLASDRQRARAALEASLFRDEAGAAPRLRPWMDYLAAQVEEAPPSGDSPAPPAPGGFSQEEDVARECRLDRLLTAYRGFGELGEKVGEFWSALAVAELKSAWGAARGAISWVRRAESAMADGLLPAHGRQRLEALALATEENLARRLDSHRRAIGSSRPRAAGSPASGSLAARDVACALDGFRSRMGARRASLLRLHLPDLVEPVACGGEPWSEEELRAIPRSLPPDRLSLLLRGETVICTRSPFAQVRTGVTSISAEGGGAILVPLSGSEATLSLLVFEGCERPDRFLPGVEELLLASVAAEVLREALEEPRGADLLSPTGIEQAVSFGLFLTRHRPLKESLVLLNRVSPSDVPVLLQGESGTGKELLARALHEVSERGGPFVAHNCATIPDSLAEAELFGHVEGAFTGATRTRRGLLEEAHQGTFFLDEVGELGGALQAKLLRALEFGEIRPLGANRSHRVAARFISATHCDLAREVAQGRFREDLFYRLNVITVAIPPLRERREDIPLLARHFLGRAAGRERKEVPGFTPEAMDFLLRHGWPGNARELQNWIRRAAALVAPGHPVGPELFAIPTAVPGGAMEETGDLREAVRRLESERIREALARAGGNRSLAARLLGNMSRTTLLAKMKRLGISGEIPSPEGRAPAAHSSITAGLVDPAPPGSGSESVARCPHPK